MITVEWNSMSPRTKDEHEAYVRRLNEKATAQQAAHGRTTEAAFDIMDHGYFVRDTSGVDAYGYEFSAFDGDTKVASADSISELRDLVLSTLPKVSLGIDADGLNLFTGQWRRARGLAW